MDRLEKVRISQLVMYLKNCVILDQTKLVSSLMEKTLDDNITYLPFTRKDMEYVQHTALRYHFEGEKYTREQMEDINARLRHRYQSFCEEKVISEEHRQAEIRYKDSEIALHDPIDTPVLGWFVVNDFLAERLQAMGEVVLRNDYGRWWGRLTPPVPFWNDPALIAIAKDFDKNMPRSDRLKGKVAG